MTKYQKFSGKRLTIEQKNLILSDHFEKGISISELARKHSIHAVTLYSWKRKMTQKKDDNQIDIAEILAENARLQKENSGLKKSLGSLAHKNEVLADINDWLKKKHQEEQLKTLKCTSKKTILNPLKK